MHISLKKAGRSIAGILLWTTLSGCNAIWMAGLEMQRLTQKTETLPDTAIALETCQLNQPCNRTFNIQLDNWATPASSSIISGDLPPGLSYIAISTPNQPNTYTVTIEGTPLKAGDYSFQLGFECCMTMSGPMNKAGTEPITLTIAP